MHSGILFCIVDHSKGDILSGDLVRYVLSSNNIDTVIHFAAQTHVGSCFFLQQIVLTVRETIPLAIALSSQRTTFWVPTFSWNQVVLLNVYVRKLTPQQEEHTRLNDLFMSALMKFMEKKPLKYLHCCFVHF